MVHPCSVEGCRNKAKDGIFRFPRDAGLRLQWIESLRLDPASVNDQTRVCGAHFGEDDFLRDLKGELLGIPSKRKTLNPEAVPTVEKQNAGTPSVRGYKAAGRSSKTPYSNTFAAAALTTGRKPKRFSNTATPHTKKFMREKEEILQRLKQEAAMNVMRDKLSGASSFEMLEDEDAEEPLEVKPGPSRGNMHGFHPNQCVILQPMDREGDVPVIIPGDPKHIQKTLLKDKKVQQFIETQVAENRDAVAATEASAIVLNTFSKQTDLDKKCRVEKVPISDKQRQYLEEAKVKLPLPPELAHLDDSELDERDIDEKIRNAEILIREEPADQSETEHHSEFRHSIFD